MGCVLDAQRNQLIVLSIDSFTPSTQHLASCQCTLPQPSRACAARARLSGDGVWCASPSSGSADALPIAAAAGAGGGRVALAALDEGAAAAAAGAGSWACGGAWRAACHRSGWRRPIEGERTYACEPSPMTLDLRLTLTWEALVRTPLAEGLYLFGCARIHERVVGAYERVVGAAWRVRG